MCFSLCCWGNLKCRRKWQKHFQIFIRWEGLMSAAGARCSESSSWHWLDLVRTSTLAQCSTLLELDTTSRMGQSITEGVCPFPLSDSSLQAKDGACLARFWVPTCDSMSTKRLPVPWVGTHHGTAGLQERASCPSQSRLLLCSSGFHRPPLVPAPAVIFPNKKMCQEFIPLLHTKLIQISIKKQPHRNRKYFLKRRYLQKDNKYIKRY